MTHKDIQEIIGEENKPFLELRPLFGKVVSTPTQKDYDILMQIYESGGWKWADGTLPTSKNIWGDYKEKTCVTAGFNFRSGVSGEFNYGEENQWEKNNFKVIHKNHFYLIEDVRSIRKIDEWFYYNRRNRASKGEDTF